MPVVSIVPAIAVARQQQMWRARVRQYLAEQQIIHEPEDDELIDQWGYQVWIEETPPSNELEWDIQQRRRALLKLMLEHVPEEDRGIAWQILVAPMRHDLFIEEVIAPVLSGLQTGTCWRVWDPVSEGDDYVLAQDPAAAREIGADLLWADPERVEVQNAREVWV